MCLRAKIFIGMTIASGGALVAACLAGEGATTHSSAYFAYCLLALLASALKVRLPGITGTMSVNFLFILVAVAVFSFSETILLAALACVVQCLWKARRRPRLLQLSFNVAALALSSGLSYRLSHLLTRSNKVSLALLLTTGACIYYTANTLLISGVLSLVEGKPLFALWKQCYMWSFVYYLAGAAIAGLVVTTGEVAGWVMSLPILPSMYLVYVFYRLTVERLARASPGLQPTV
jgi:hypothetical protein